MADSKPDKRLATALARFKLASEAEHDQREREVEDLRFVDFDEQWPEDVRRSREGYMAGGNAIPARPCLTINKLRQPIEQVTTSARNARLSLNISPKGDGAKIADAEIIEDITRGIQVDSRAHLARQWAFDRAAKAGRGAYRILTEYANDGDFDLDIVYKRILNQSSVYLDPAAEEPDWSDGEWAFITSDLSLDKYKAKYGGTKLADADPGDLEGYGDAQPQWIRNKGTGDDSDVGWVVRVAEYWYVEHQKETIGLYRRPDGAEVVMATADAGPSDEPVADATGQPMTRTRDVRRVKWCLINALEIIEENDWPGRYIPIVPVIGLEANVNGERRWTGMVRPARDSARSYNYMVSAEVEGIGLMPKAPYVAYMEAIEPYKGWWDQANTRNFPYLPVALVRDAAGNPVPPPQRNVVEPAIQAIIMAKSGAAEDIRATTGVPAASLGELNANERSGKAILALQKQSEQQTSSYIDNLASMSMIYEGKVLLDLIPHIYSRPGRIVAAIGADDQRRNVMLGTPFVQQGGEPAPARPDQMKEATTIDLTRGSYSVAVTVGKSFSTRREEAAGSMGALAEAAPQLVPAFADIWVKNMDGPGMQQVADRLKKMLPPQLQDQQDTPDMAQIQQDMQKAQEMIDQLTAELQAKNDLIETEQVKADADLRLAEVNNAAKVQIASIQAQTQLTVAEMGAEVKVMSQQMAAFQAELQQMRQHASQVELQAQQGQQAQTQQVLQGDQRQQELAQQGEQQQAQTMLQGQQAQEQAMLQAELAPEPTQGGEA